jgi:colanic acid/amylovoran biosynthesis protein
MAEAAAAFLASHPGAKAVFFPQSTGPSAAEDDRHVARRIARRIADRLPGAAARVVVVEQAVAPALLKSAFGRMDIFLGTRMHSVIFALAEAVPCVAVGYLHKSRGIMRMAGQAERLADIRGVDGAGLAGRLEAVWAEREPIRRALREVAPRLAAQADQAGAWIAEDFAGLARRGGDG